MASDELSNIPKRAVRLRDYRYPGEVLSLLLTFVLLGTIFFVVTIFFPSTWSATAKTFLLTSAGLAVFFISVKLQQRAAVGTLVRVSQRQFPELFAIATNAAERLSCHYVPVYVKRASEMNIYTLGLWQQPLIVLTSSLVDQMPPDALQFFIGRELGHVNAGHTWLRTLLKPLGADVPVIGRLLNSVIFGDWMNRTEFTADRAGYIASRSLTTSVSTMLKFGVGIRLYEKLDIREFLDQINEVHDVRGHLTEIMAEQPYLVQRVRSLVSFALDETTQEFVPQKRGRTDILKDLPTAFLAAAALPAALRTNDPAAHDIGGATAHAAPAALALSDASVGMPATAVTLPDAASSMSQSTHDDGADDENAWLDTVWLMPLDQTSNATARPLRRQCTRIGRQRDNDIVIESERVSRFHAKITHTKEAGWRIHDLESRNGVWVNETKVNDTAPLVAGDKIRIGRFAFTFTDRSISDDPSGNATQHTNERASAH